MTKMTTAYDIRDEHGTMKARIDYKMLSYMTNTPNGKWRPYNKKVCFEYTADMCMDFNNIGVPLVLYLWVGDKIIPVD